VRIVLADDHPIFRHGLRRLLEAEPDLVVVAEAVDADEAVTLAKEVGPDILLLDVAMPRLSGLDALGALSGLAVPPRIILLTAAIEDADVAKALQRGARGVVLKEAATGVLLKAIRTVAGGGYWVGWESGSDLAAVLRTPSAPPHGSDETIGRLTQRELQVVQLIAAAAGNRRIAETLAISEKTVKHHLSNIYEKLGVTSRLELALFAAQHHLGRSDR
jgi:DNA-binding NarL/FixJ family response regulator